MDNIMCMDIVTQLFLWFLIKFLLHSVFLFLFDLVISQFKIATANCFEFSFHSIESFTCPDVHQVIFQLSDNVLHSTNSLLQVLILSMLPIKLGNLLLLKCNKFILLRSEFFFYISYLLLVVAMHCFITDNASSDVLFAYFEVLFACGT